MYDLTGYLHACHILRQVGFVAVRGVARTVQRRAVRFMTRDQDSGGGSREDLPVLRRAPEAVPRALAPWLALSGTLLLRHRHQAIGQRFAALCSVRQTGTCTSSTRASFRACARALLQPLILLLCTSLLPFLLSR